MTSVVVTLFMETTSENPDIARDVFLDHASRFVSFDDGANAPPPGFARLERPLVIVIAKHLYLETQLIRLVERELRRPEALNLPRYGFIRLLALAVAMGVVSPDEQPGLVAFNRLRNRFAHDPDWHLTNENVLEVFHALTPEQRRIAGDIPLPTETDCLVNHVASLLSVHFILKVTHGGDVAGAARVRT